MNYKKIFSETLSKILKQKKVEIENEEDFGVASATIIKYIEGIAGQGFPEEVTSFYTKFNGGYFSWKIKEAGQLCRGSFLFPGILGMFSNLMEEENHENAFEGLLWTKEAYTKKEISERKKHKIFEYIYGQSAYITIKFLGDKNYKLYYMDRSKIEPIPLTLSQYFEVVTSLYGLDNIRNFLHIEEFYTKPMDICPNLRKLPNVFPEINLVSILNNIKLEQRNPDS